MTDMTDVSELQQAVEVLAGTGISMVSEDMVDDVLRLVSACADEDELFMDAVASTARAFAQLRDHAVEGVPLQADLGRWLSYHYQNRRVNGHRVNMRILYRFEHRDDGTTVLKVLSFGNRHRPSDIYRYTAHHRDV